MTDTEDDKVIWEVQQFSNVRKLLIKDQFAKALDACNKILIRHPNDNDALHIKVVCFIQLSKFSSALEIAGKHEFLKFECAYCHYRLNDNKKALEICEGFPSPKSEKVKHLQAQAQYKLEMYNESMNSYAQFVGATAEPDMELLCNVYASYTAAGQAMEVLDSFPLSDTDTDSSKYDSSFEVYYNRACAHIATKDTDAAYHSLKTAKDVCVRVLQEEGCSQDEVQKECLSLDLQHAYLQIVTGKISGALDTCRHALRLQQGKNKDLELMAVAANNLAVLRGDKELPDSLRRLRTTITDAAEGKLAPSQLRELRFNRCILLLHLRKTDEALRNLEELETIYGAQNVLIRASLVRASALASQRKWTECDVVIESALRQCSGRSSAENGGGGADVSVEELHLLRVQTLIARTQYGDALKTLLTSVPQLRLQPAMVSAVYQLSVLRDGDSVAALDTLFQTAKDAAAVGSELSDEARKLILLKVTGVLRDAGRTAQAAQTLQTLLSSGSLVAEERLSVMTDLVLLLSHTDSEAAERLVQNLPVPETSTDLLADELEKRDIPRIGRTGTGAAKGSNAKTDMAAGTGDKERKKGPSPEQKARRKAKRRELYLLQLQATGKYEPSRPVKPDPERWIPRNQRSYAKRGRRNRQKFVGGQGSGDGAQKDMVKLDVYARAQAKKEEDAKLEEEKAKEGADGLRKPPPGRSQRRKR
eukprot:gene4624-9182_t